MPALNWNEIRLRAAQFSADWAGATSERGESQSFWDSFFNVFGVRRRQVAAFEQQVQKLAPAGQSKTGRMDVFWPGMLLGEHKSAGEDLHAAYQQALGYLHGLTPAEHPRYIVVCDFARFHLYDLEERTECQFSLSELAANIHLFGFIAGYQTRRIREDDPINERAVQLLGDLHDLLKKDGYGGEKLEVFLVRLVFCLFADDTGIFNPKDIFTELLKNHSKPDGSDTGALIAKLFEVLATQHEARQKSLDEDLALFPYVNGRLFEKPLPMPDFNSAMRDLLLQCCALNWSAISPAIFGAMFQAIIELDAKDRRRQLGAHYTSEKNILRLIDSLFLNELKAEFERVKGNKNALFEFHKKLRTLTFLDPACGCGNFLVVTYRELRELELQVLQAAQKFAQVAHIFEAIQVNVDQFYGIEVEEFPAQIAQVALWLMDHQMNVKAGQAFGDFFNRIPLKTSATIRRGNALRLDWEDFIPPQKLSFILGNPPFIGGKFQSAEQRADMQTITHGIKGAGVLDYVAGWYLKAAHYVAGHNLGALDAQRKQFESVRFGSEGNVLQDLFAQADAADDLARQRIRCAFVSTNSITQGEQVGVLWSELLRRGVSIQFAHRTFKWTNDAPGKAAVHCVMVGFGREIPPSPPTPLPRGERGAKSEDGEVGKRRASTPLSLDGRGAGGEGEMPHKTLFDYPDIQGDPVPIAAAHINPYLVDAPDVMLVNRERPLCDVPQIGIGNKPIDGGNYLFTPEEKADFLKREPQAAAWFRRWIGADEFINGCERWCLWLGDCPPNVLRQMPEVSKRVEAVRQFRLASKSAPTQKLASTPLRFHVENIPDAPYLVIPEVSSEKRAFVPIGFMSPETLSSNLVKIVPNATLYHFGILTSTMHNAWMRTVCGRLKSDYRYSAGIVYNNFPWPQIPSNSPLSGGEQNHSSPDKGRLGGVSVLAIETAAQAILDARLAHPGNTLADLYHPNTMPQNLRAAHAALDRAVDAAYALDGGQKKWKNEAERVAFLFRRYQALSGLLGA